MTLQLKLFRTRVARRVFILFMLVALIPVTATAVLALNHIGRSLTGAAQQQLRDASRSYGQLIYRRLLFAEAALSRWPVVPEAFDPQRAPPEFEAVALIVDDEIIPLYGELRIEDFATIEPPETGRPSLLTASSTDGVDLLIARRVESGDLLIGRVSPDYLWDRNTLRFGVEISVFASGTASPLFFTSPVPESEIQTVIGSDSPPSGDLSWDANGQQHLAAYWELFVQSGFDGAPWRIVASQDASLALAALISFRQLFPPVVFLSLIMAVLLSIWQIRRSMVPLDHLVRGTQRIADRDFETRLTIGGRDEFAELAQALNTMADRLGHQFGALNTLAEIDRLILSSEDLEHVIETVLQQTQAILPCDGAGLILLDEETPELGHLYLVTHGTLPEDASLSRVPTSEREREWLRDHPKGQFLDSGDAPVLAPFEARGLDRTLVFPILKGDAPAGALVFGFSGEADVAEESRQAACDLADRLAVAMSASERDAALFDQAHFDALTGLPNRQLCYDRLRQALAQARRDEHQLAVLFLDLDGFKTINDSLGHSSGDTLLREAGSRLNACVRDTDTVARLGGDEFVVILPRVIGATEIEAVAGNIMRALARPFWIDGKEVFITASIGVTMYPEDGSTVDELLRKADAAMYDAKDAGRARYVFFTNEIDDRVSERLSLETDLRYALDRNELILRYQPQVDLVTDEIVCAEALVRWNHPKRGRVSPELFIPIVEEMGLIDSIGGWVLRTAADQLRCWQSEGLPIHRIAVNVSALQFRQPNFVERVEDVLRAAGITANALELEITESAVVEDMQQSNESLGRLRELGVKVSIDDFGTGYSSFSYLKNLQFDAVKIDRAFVRDLPDPRAVAIAKAIVAVGQTLEKTVIAEGVEKDVQLVHLKELGCDLAQGFLIGRPMDSDDFAHWLAKTAAGEDLSASFIARAFGSLPTRSLPILK